MNWECTRGWIQPWAFIMLFQGVAFRMTLNQLVCIGLRQSFKGIHPEGSTNRRDYKSIVIENVHEWLPNVLAEIPFSSITQLVDEVGQ